MHNIHELEKRWLRYKIKSFIPHVSVTLISILAFIVFMNLDINSMMETETKPTKILSKKIQKVEVAQAPILNIDVIKEVKIPLLKNEPIHKEKNVLLTPSFDFIRKLRNDSTSNYQSNGDTLQEVKTEVTPKIQKKVHVKQDTVVRKKKKQKLKISKQETQADIAHVIKRFHKNNNPALSLFVAKKYYRLGEYDKSYNYALITNQLNNNIDESWIIFSKSLVKLGKRDQAIQTLKRYITFSHSQNAKSLLDNILSGNFK